MNLTSELTSARFAPFYLTRSQVTRALGGRIYIMDEPATLIAHYHPLVTSELQRIGFTDDDFRYLGSGGEFTRAALDAHLAELREIPSGIGATAYYARLGVDFAAIKRWVDERASAEFARKLPIA